MIHTVGTRLALASMDFLATTVKRSTAIVMPFLATMVEPAILRRLISDVNVFLDMIIPPAAFIGSRVLGQTPA